MARVSKKGINLDAEAEKDLEKAYRAGIYARLSVEEKGGSGRQRGKDKSNDSIEAQIEIARAFIRSQKDMVLSGCYTDIGKTGTNFKREGFERMMQDVKMQKINCIIVKDLSRFGRNHIETGNYIEKIFPFLGVRLIAVTDNFDSINRNGENEKLGVNLKNLVNEMYAKDIAVKVKSSRLAKWEQGSYMGGAVPYGYYAKQEDGKKCLYVQAVTSDIVTNMFQLYLSGKNIKEIVAWLYEERIVSPSEYRKTGEIYCLDQNRLKQWPDGSVKMILTNPVYMGCLVWQKKEEGGKRIQKRVDIDSGNWSVKAHTHEAIIDEEMFYAAAERFNRSLAQWNKSGYTPKVPTKEDAFAGILYCGDCRLKLKRITSIKKRRSKETVRAYSYNCPNISRIDTDKCVSKSITQSGLNDIIKEALWREALLSPAALQPLVESITRKAEKQKEERNRQLSCNKKRIENIRKLESELYFRYRVGETDMDSFIRIKEENRKKLGALQKQKDSIAEKLKSIDAEAVRKKQFLHILSDRNEKRTFQAEAVKALISKIEVYPGHRVEIIFSFKEQGMLDDTVV